MGPFPVYLSSRVGELSGWYVSIVFFTTPLVFAELFNYLKQLNKFNLLNNLFSITCINNKDMKFLRFKNTFRHVILLFLKGLPNYGTQVFRPTL